MAGCLLLLYAQPVTRIARLTRDHLHIVKDAPARLKLGHQHLDLPEPLGQLISRLPVRSPGGIAAHLPSNGWLFPGRRPGQHIHATVLANRLAALGIDSRADRNSALLQYARELPPTVIGKLLGLHPNTVERWAILSGGKWVRYITGRPET